MATEGSALNNPRPAGVGGYRVEGVGSRGRNRRVLAGVALGCALDGRGGSGGFLAGAAVGCAGRRLVVGNIAGLT
jgi:hypothetical protein